MGQKPPHFTYLQWDCGWMFSEPSYNSVQSENFRSGFRNFATLPRQFLFSITILHKRLGSTARLIKWTDGLFRVWRFGRASSCLLKSDCIFGHLSRSGRKTFAVDDLRLVGNLDGQRSQAEEHDVTGVSASAPKQRIRPVKSIQHAQNAKVLVELEMVEIVGLRRRQKRKMISTVRDCCLQDGDGEPKPARCQVAFRH